MNLRESLHTEIEQIPETLLPEILDFIQDLKYKHCADEKIEIALLSESALARDWLREEEEKAWQHLSREKWL